MSADDPIVIAHKVASFNLSEGNPFDLLNLAPNVPPVDAKSSVDACRGNYRRLAVLIHPDRIRAKFEHATEAFQKLVRVFEMISDPTIRRQIEKRLAPKKGAVGIASKTPKAKTTKTKKATTTSKPKPKKTAAPKRKKKSDSSEDDDDESDDGFIVHGGSEEDISEDEEQVSDDDDNDVDYIDNYEDDLGLRPSKARDNTNCHKTKIACPNCRERWQPDDDRAYVLFMKYGVKMHCATCLIQFGPATALHYCPLCKKTQSTGQSEDGGYDVSQYDKKVTCRCCRKPYGFFSCLITEGALEGARDRIRSEEATRKRSEERMLRALSRGIKVAEVEVMSAAKAPTGGGGTGLASTNTDGQLDMLVGQALVTGTCSLCHKNVAAKSAQSHVEKCYNAPAKKAAAKKALPKVVAEKPAPKPKKALATKAPAKKKAPAAKKAKPAKTKSVKKKADGKKRPRDESEEDSSSSSDDSSSYSSYSDSSSD